MKRGNMLEISPFLTQCRTARDLDLRGAELRGQQLADLRAEDLDMSEADLRDTVCTNIHWRNCTLTDARLDAADCTDAVLRMCDLDQARATSAVFVRARIENCTARAARLDGADLSNATLTDTDFSRASLRNANLRGVSATGASFRGADLRNTRLQHADLTDADLRGADLTNADLSDATLTGADLTGCVGLDPALQPNERAWGDLPTSLQPLAETVVPMIQEALRSAELGGSIDPRIAEQLHEQAARYPSSPRNAPSANTLAAVSRVFSQLGQNGLPTLLGALQQPDGSAPSPEVQAMILRLRDELGLAETATAEDVFEALAQDIGRAPQQP